MTTTISYLQENAGIYLNEVDSTNTELTKNKYSAGSWLYAGHQTAGRGRKQRIWLDTEQNLAFSAKITIQGQQTALQTISLLVGEAISQTCNLFLTHPTSEVKWPNDVFLTDKKIAGTLIETSTLGDTTTCIIGIGVNFILPANSKELPQAGSLFQTPPSEKEKMSFVEKLVQNINLHLAYLQDPENLNQKITNLYQHSYLKGKKISTEYNNTTIQAEVIGYTQEGFLLIRHQDEKIILYDSPPKFEVL